MLLSRMNLNRYQNNIGNLHLPLYIFSETSIETFKGCKF